MNRASLIIVGLLSIPLGCRALPDDLSDPRHAYYVASGQKADDRKAFQAAVMVCMQLLPSFNQAVYQYCTSLPNPSDCIPPGGAAVIDAKLVLYCADHLSCGNRHSSARKNEFVDDGTAI